MALICLGGMIAALIAKIVEVKEAAPGEQKMDAQFLCHSLMGMSCSLAWIVITISMCVLTIKIKKSIALVN